MFKILVFLAIGGMTIALPSHKSYQKHTQKQGLSIFGGHDVDITDYPYQVALSCRGKFYCSGFLISENWVVTAGYCLQNIPEEEIFVRAGSSSYEIGGENIPIIKYIINPNYHFIYPDSDIGLIQLAKNVSTANASPARLPATGDSVEEGALLTITGWGTTENNITANHLQGSTLSVINHQNCIKTYEENPLFVITENMFCAGGDKKGVCNKDSGGPTSVDGVVVGIVSLSEKCGDIDYPGVFTKVSNFRDWIKEQTGI